MVVGQYSNRRLVKHADSIGQRRWLRFSTGPGVFLTPRSAKLARRVLAIAPASLTSRARHHFAVVFEFVMNLGTLARRGAPRITGAARPSGEADIWRYALAPAIVRAGYWFTSAVRRDAWRRSIAKLSHCYSMRRRQVAAVNFDDNPRTSIAS